MTRWLAPLVLMPLLAGCATMQSGTDVGEMEPRRQHYLFGKYLLPQIAFNEGLYFFEGLWHEGRDVIVPTWNHLADDEIEEATRNPAGLTVQNIEVSDSTRYIFVILPTPQAPPENYYTILRREGGSVGVYGLERGVSFRGEEQLFLVAYSNGGTRFNLGSGWPKEIDALVAAIEESIARDEEPAMPVAERI